MTQPAGVTHASAWTAVGAVRVPQITVMFWLVKLVTTGMGETASDFLVKRFVPEIVVGITFVVLVAALVAQFRARRYIAWLYWTCALLVSIFGTMAADIAHIVLGVPYAVSTVAFAIAVAVVLVVWRRVEGTLDVHEIRSARREAFYWATVVCTFALGTAAGDLTATALGLGYFGSILLFAVLIAVPFVGWRVLRWNAIGSFWAAYVLTRPLGASVADWLAVEHTRGGLNLGTGPVSLVALLVFALLVAGLQLRPARTVVSLDR